MTTALTQEKENCSHRFLFRFGYLLEVQLVASLSLQEDHAFTEAGGSLEEHLAHSLLGASGL